MDEIGLVLFSFIFINLDLIFHFLAIDFFDGTELTFKSL